MYLELQGFGEAENEVHNVAEKSRVPRSERRTRSQDLYSGPRFISAHTERFL